MNAEDFISPEAAAALLSKSDKLLNAYTPNLEMRKDEQKQYIPYADKKLEKVQKEPLTGREIKFLTDMGWTAGQIKEAFDKTDGETATMIKYLVFLNVHK